MSTNSQVSPALNAADKSITGDSACIASVLPLPASSSSKAKFAVVVGSASKAAGSVL